MTVDTLHVDRLRVLEMYASTPVEECEKRDPKACTRVPAQGNSKASRASTLPIEPPKHPDLVLDTTGAEIDQVVAHVIDLLKRHIT